MRRIVPIVFALSLVLAACGGGDDSGGEGAAADPGDCPVGALDEVEGTVEVVVWNSLVAEPLRAATEMIDEYNASQDKVRVRLENQGVSYEEMQRQFNSAIRTGDLPGLVILEDTQTQFMADSGVILPAEACAEASDVDLDDFLPVVRNYYSVDGVLQPAASNLSTAVMYYNRDHFVAAGLDPDDPPGTLTELRQTAEALAAAGVSDNPVVMVLQPWYVEHWLSGAGTEIVNNNNGRDALADASAFDSETTLELYTWLEQMADDGLLRGVAGTEGQIDHLFAVALQQASITFETSTAIATINAVLEGTATPDELGLEGIDDLPPIDIDIGVAPYPGIDAPGSVQAGGGVFYIPNTTAPEVQAAAWDFMTWFNQPDQQVTWSMGSSYLPWNTAAVETDTLETFWSTTRPGMWTRISYDQIEALDPDFPGPLIGPYTEVRSAIRRSLDDLVLGASSPQEAVAAADQRIDEAVSAYADDNF